MRHVAEFGDLKDHVGKRALVSGIRITQNNYNENVYETTGESYTGTLERLRGLAPEHTEPFYIINTYRTFKMPGSRVSGRVVDNTIIIDRENFEARNVMILR